jgi:nicotinamidase-related amidase
VIVGSPGSQIAQPLLPSPLPCLDADLLLRGAVQQIGSSEWIIFKPRWGAFYKTPLESHLRDLDVTTLIFAGCNYPNCPRTSIYEASERDYRIVAIGDAISGLDERGRRELQNIGVVIRDTDEYLVEAAV